MSHIPVSLEPDDLSALFEELRRIAKYELRHENDGVPPSIITHIDRENRVAHHYLENADLAVSLSCKIALHGQWWANRNISWKCHPESPDRDITTAVVTWVVKLRRGPETLASDVHRRLKKLLLDGTRDVGEVWDDDDTEIVNEEVKVSIHES